MNMGLFYLLIAYSFLIIHVTINQSTNSFKGSFARVLWNSPNKTLLPEHNLLLNLSKESFTASSVWKNANEFEPYQARIIRIEETNLAGHAWCPKKLITSVPEEFIEIDLGDLKLIKNLVTAGRGDGNFKEYAPFYYLEYQRMPDKWHRYRNQENKQKIRGNTDARNVAMRPFDSLIIARKLRIYPVVDGIPIRACMRLALYGFDFDDGVVEYSVNQGHYYMISDNDKYDLRDLTYDGFNSTEKINTATWLNGGIGQLMDNIVYTGTVNDDNDYQIRGYHFVGWNRKILSSQKVEITFKFDQIRYLKQIRLYALNMIREEIGIFSRAIIHFSIGGQSYDKIASYHFKTVSDKRVYYSRWIEIHLESVLTRYVKIDLIFDLDWIVLSEIIIISEKANTDLPVEIETLQPESSITNEVINKKQKIFQETSTRNLITTIRHNTDKDTNIDTNRSSSFTANSNLGLIATISSCFLGFMFLIALIAFGVFTLRRHNRRSKGKLRYPIYQTRMNGGPFIGDSVVVPLTGGTHSSSGTGSIYYKHPGSVELGLTYPVMGKEYMTLSSKSGTDYDMAGGNSLDGLIPTGTRDLKYNALGSYAPQIGQSDSPYPNNIYSRNSMDGSTGGSSTDYASTSLYHFSQVLENGSSFHPYNQQGMNSFALHKINPPTMSSLNGTPFKVQSPTPSAQMFPPNQVMDIFSQYSPYRQLSHVNHFSPAHSTSSRFLMPSNIDLYPTPYMMQSNNFQFDQSIYATTNMPSLQGISGNSVMVTINETSLQSSTNPISLKTVLSKLKEFHHEQIEHVSVIGKGENGIIGFINIAQNVSTDDNTNSVVSKPFIYRSLNNYNSKDVKYETIKELELLCGIKNSAFLPLTAYVLDQQNSMSIQQTTLCFLFEFDEPLENLHSFLHQHAMNKAAILNLPRGPTLYSQSISNISANSSFDTRHLYPSISSLIFIITQISRGMSYLENHKIIHRDLAARNCLIGKNLKIKITDIAMSIQKFKEHYTECSIVNIQKTDNDENNSSISVVKRFYPLQWMSFETILQATFSNKTDIWSFGVMMWEILNRCQLIPYGGFGISFDRIRDNAYNLSIGNSSAILPSGNLYPHQCQSNSRSPQQMNNQISSILNNNLGLSRDFSDLIKECWCRNPNQRPSFKVISSFLEQKINNFEFNIDHTTFQNKIPTPETY